MPRTRFTIVKHAPAFQKPCLTTEVDFQLRSLHLEQSSISSVEPGREVERSSCFGYALRDPLVRNGHIFLRSGLGTLSTSASLVAHLRLPAMPSHKFISSSLQQS